ncbi:MAG: AI-2E family transporter [Tannerella sp.]|jgi:predicted PurR-regulated permease PerM|nr:AI-2E family transporter [Tannerella sp.]
MMIKEKYLRYSLIGLITLMGWFIVSGLWAYMNGLFGAFTVFVLVRNQMIYLTEKRHVKKALAAALILLEVSACVLVPLYMLTWALVNKMQEVNLDIKELIETVRHLISMIEDKTGYDLLNVSNIEAATGFLTRSVQAIISQVGGVFIATFVMILLLYFMLISRQEIEDYTYHLLPFSDDNKQAVMVEVRRMVRSNAIGIPMLAFIQGIIALTGYWATGVPSPVLFGALTAFAGIIPLVGTGIVWAPLVVYLALTGNWIAAICLAAYCGLILINIDNVIRFLLQKKLADIHPLITIFGVILGLKLFGFWGIIFGPLLLSMFCLLVNIFKKKYLDR